MNTEQKFLSIRKGRATIQAILAKSMRPYGDPIYLYKKKRDAISVLFLMAPDVAYESANDIQRAAMEAVKNKRTMTFDHANSFSGYLSAVYNLEISRFRIDNGIKIAKDGVYSHDGIFEARASDVWAAGRTSTVGKPATGLRHLREEIKKLREKDKDKA